MTERLPFNDPDYIASPYETWRWLRDEAPAYWSERHRFWAITRYDDVIAVLHDPARFSSKGGPIGRSEQAGLPRQPLIQDDPPHHDRLRRILSKAFTPKVTAERAPRVREIAMELADEIRCALNAGEPVDLVAAFTSPLPVRVIAEILGIPKRLHDRLRMWNATTSVTGAAGQAMLDNMPAVMQEMHRMLGDLIEERRVERRSDLFSALLDASEDDESPLSSEELVGLSQLLWAAGNETTTNLLSNAALVFHEQPEILELVQQEPERIPAVTEELLRMHSPVNGLARVANVDVELHGETIREDDVLMILFGAANRDPRHFERPDEFDPTRKPNDHVAFGHGIHFCLGSHLARLEARVGIEALAELLRHARALPARGARIPTGILRGWLSLPLAPR